MLRWQSFWKNDKKKKNLDRDLMQNLLAVLCLLHASLVYCSGCQAQCVIAYFITMNAFLVINRCNLTSPECICIMVMQLFVPLTVSTTPPVLGI